MGEKDTFKKILGLTQDEIAPLLGITRAQWAMYEIGKRNLPSAAAVEFTKLLHYIQENHSKEMEMQDFMKEEEKRVYDQLRKDMQKNEYKLNRLTKKMERAQGLYEEALAALQVIAYLESQPKNEKTATIKNVIQHKTRVNLIRQKEILRKHSHDIEVLQLENTLLKKKMKIYLKAFA
ncbi:helix-turn-helix domain-containing protein [Flavobacterium amniphilum]|uniref:helix-turn-helix domain-containing protein n=1 Tax=Flavobacterium amniphilum TaxID=1834035 RepID=UPI00202A5E65|nr:helix-turn-helix transcriptional regulator [Flavobacterium amniphilum]MCL9803890.1 helix-turn-helix domain-containing protein [Flavobacterium amniphilum]